MVLLEEHLLQILPTVRGSIVSTAGQNFSACTQGEPNPLPLMTKGENDLRILCCHQVQRGIFLELWYRFGAMAQVLSLMATLSGDRSHFKFSE